MASITAWRLIQSNLGSVPHLGFYLLTFHVNQANLMSAVSRKSMFSRLTERISLSCSWNKRTMFSLCFVLLQQIIAVTFRGILHCGQESVTVAMIERIFDRRRETRWGDGSARKMRNGGWDRERIPSSSPSDHKHSGTFCCWHFSFRHPIHLWGFCYLSTAVGFWKIHVKWEGK